jgi:hypothetical protein
MVRPVGAEGALFAPCDTLTVLPATVIDPVRAVVVPFNATE